MICRKEQKKAIRQITDDILQSLSDGYDEETMQRICNLLQEINDIYATETPKCKK